jgi:hypothetical protein
MSFTVGMVTEFICELLNRHRCAGSTMFGIDCGRISKTGAHNSACSSRLFVLVVLVGETLLVKDTLEAVLTGFLLSEVQYNFVGAVNHKLQREHKGSSEKNGLLE